MKHTLLATAIAAGLSAAAAEAATVTPTSDVTFVFDLSSYGELSFNLSEVFCPVECAGSDNPLKLAAGATMQVNLGTPAGASDLGSRTYTNVFDSPVSNMVGYVLTAPSIDVAASLDALYATFVYVDDVYGVEEFNLRDFHEGVYIKGSLLPVPLPATLPLLLVGMGGMAVLGRRRA